MPRVRFVLLLSLVIGSRTEAAEPVKFPPDIDKTKSAPIIDKAPGAPKPDSAPKRDTSIYKIVVPDIVPPKSLPPLPDELTLNVILESEKLPRPLEIYGVPETSLSPGATPTIKKTDTKDADSKAAVAKDAISKAPFAARDENNEAVKLGMQGKLVEAIAHHQEALKMDKNNIAFRTNYSSAELQLADKLAKANKILEAETHYRRAVFIDSKNTPASAGLDRCIKARGLDPKNAEVRATMALAADRAGNFETAVVEGHAAATINDTTRARALLGHYLIKARMVVEAFNQYAAAAEKGLPANATQEQRTELSDSHKELGSMLVRYANVALTQGRRDHYLKRLQSAWIEYRRALFLNPENTEVIKALATISKKAVDLHNNAFDNQLALGSASLLAGDTTEAARRYDLCKQINPQDKRLPEAAEALKSRK